MTADRLIHRAGAAGLALAVILGLSTAASGPALSEPAPVSARVAATGTTSEAIARHSFAQRRVITSSFVTSDDGRVPTGQVRFVLRRNGVKVAAKVVSLNGNEDPTRNYARVVFEKVRAAGVYKVVSIYRGSGDFSPSRDSFTIRRREDRPR